MEVSWCVRCKRSIKSMIASGIVFVQIAGGFIRQQHRRFVHQRSRNRHALLLSPGQLRSPVLRPRCQPHFLSQRLSGLPSASP